MTGTLFERLKGYVGLPADATPRLRALAPHARPHFPAIVQDFYAAVETHPETRAVITGADAQVARLKVTLLDWLETLLVGPHDEAYCERRARIGRVHVRVGLPQAFMFVALGRIRVQLLAIIEGALAADTEARAATRVALDNLLDLELAIMLETYREDSEARQRTAERLSMVGQIAAGIGHELRNPLAVMESSLYLLRQQLQEPARQEPAIARHLERISAEIQRSNKTIDDLLELARGRTPHRRPVALEAIVDQARARVRTTDAVRIHVLCADDLQVEGDSDQLAQLLANLIQNAQQAIGLSGGQVWIEASRENGQVRVRVRDDGPGFPREARHRAFEALFTTKPGGSGLGLALCRRIAEAHGGSLVLEPGPGGASFLLALPAPGKL